MLSSSCHKHLHYLAMRSALPILNESDLEVTLTRYVKIRLHKNLNTLAEGKVIKNKYETKWLLKSDGCWALFAKSELFWEQAHLCVCVLMTCYIIQHSPLHSSAVSININTSLVDSTLARISVRICVCCGNMGICVSDSHINVSMIQHNVHTVIWKTKYTILQF